MRYSDNRFLNEDVYEKAFRLICEATIIRYGKNGPVDVTHRFKDPVKAYYDASKAGKKDGKPKTIDYPRIDNVPNMKPRDIDSANDIAQELAIEKANELGIPRITRHKYDFKDPTKEEMDVDYRSGGAYHFKLDKDDIKDLRRLQANDMPPI